MKVSEKVRLLVATCACITLPVFAINNNIETTLPVTEGAMSKVIPYGFYNSETGVAVAAVFLGKGQIQEQATTVANAFVGSSGSYNIFLSNLDLKLPFSRRLFVDQVAFYSNWDEVETYQDGNPDFPNERAGTNGSDEKNFLKAEGEDLFVFFNFKYLLPIGHGRETPPHDFNLTDGMLNPGSEAGGNGWNPFESGRTILEFRPFYRQQNFEETDSSFDLENETAGVKLSIEYDNTDWYNNPTRGTRQRLTWARDWGMLDGSKSWTAIQGRHSHYFDFGESESAQRRVLALDVWASHSPTWNDLESVKGEEVFSRPPLFEGSTLGGLEQQRGYANSRYWDRSALNYSAEYRYTPRWNPLTDIPYINKLYIPWWQWVGFLELGRVHDQFDLKELHQNMKYTVGGGVRALVQGLVIRVDVGVGKEGGEVQMFFNHPF